MNPFLRRLLATALFGLCGACAAKVPATPKAEWLIEVKEDKDGNPHSTVDLVINDRQVVHVVSSDGSDKVMHVVPSDGTSNFEVIPPDEWAKRSTAKALCACFSWWAGRGMELYAVANAKGEVEVYQTDLWEHQMAHDAHSLRICTIRVEEP